MSCPKGHSLVPPTWSLPPTLAIVLGTCGFFIGLVRSGIVPIIFLIIALAALFGVPWFILRPRRSWWLLSIIGLLVGLLITWILLVIYILSTTPDGGSGQNLPAWMGTVPLFTIIGIAQTRGVRISQKPGWILAMFLGGVVLGVALGSDAQSLRASLTAGLTGLSIGWTAVLVRGHYSADPQSRTLNPLG